MDTCFSLGPNIESKKKKHFIIYKINFHSIEFSTSYLHISHSIVLPSSTRHKITCSCNQFSHTDTHSPCLSQLFSYSTIFYSFTYCKCSNYLPLFHCHSPSLNVLHIPYTLSPLTPFFTLSSIHLTHSQYVTITIFFTRAPLFLTQYTSRLSVVLLIHTEYTSTYQDF